MDMKGAALVSLQWNKIRSKLKLCCEVWGFHSSRYEGYCLL